MQLLSGSRKQRQKGAFEVPGGNHTAHANRANWLKTSAIGSQAVSRLLAVSIVDLLPS